MLASTEFTLILSMRLNTTKDERQEGGKAKRPGACEPVRPQDYSSPYIFITHNESLPACSLSA